MIGKKNVPGIATIHHPLRHVDAGAGKTSAWHDTAKADSLGASSATILRDLSKRFLLDPGKDLLPKGVLNGISSDALGRISSRGKRRRR